MGTSKVISVKSGGGVRKDGTVYERSAVVNVVGEENYMQITLSQLYSQKTGLKDGMSILVACLKGSYNRSAPRVIKPRAKKRRKSAQFGGKSGKRSSNG